MQTRKHESGKHEKSKGILEHCSILLSKHYVGGTDIPVCALARTGRNACATNSDDALVAQQSIIRTFVFSCSHLIKQQPWIAPGPITILEWLLE
jgi:hypothetical protein